MPSKLLVKPPSSKKLIIHDRQGRPVPARPRDDKPFMDFFKALPDFDEFKTALAMSEDPRFNLLLEQILDPANTGINYVVMARRANVTLAEMHNFWKEYNHHRGMIRMVGHMPDVMEDIAKDARSTVENCPSCHGAGEKDGIPCKRCNQTGEVRLPGDNNSRQLLFEALGYKQKGPLVAIQQNFDSGSLVEQTSKEIQKILQGN